MTYYVSSGTLNLTKPKPKPPVYVMFFHLIIIVALLANKDEYNFEHFF